MCWWFWWFLWFLTVERQWHFMKSDVLMIFVISDCRETVTFYEVWCVGDFAVVVLRCMCGTHPLILSAAVPCSRQVSLPAHLHPSLQAPLLHHWWWRRHNGRQWWWQKISSIQRQQWQRFCLGVQEWKGGRWQEPAVLSKVWWPLHPRGDIRLWETVLSLFIYIIIKYETLTQGAVLLT